MNQPPTAPPDVAILESTAQAASALDPVRIRILHHLRTPDSASGTARALRAPRQRIGYHIRALTKAGLLLRSGERRQGNGVEQLLRTSAASYVIGPHALGAVALDPSLAQDRYSSTYLIATAYRALLDVSTLQHLARDQKRFLPTLTLEAEVSFDSSERQAAFANELAETVKTLSTKYTVSNAPESRRFRVVAVVHPAVDSGAPSDSRDLS